jgi:hypothetical protein
MRKYIRENGNGHANREESTSYIGESQPLVFKKIIQGFNIGEVFSPQVYQDFGPFLLGSILCRRDLNLGSPSWKRLPLYKHH